MKRGLPEERGNDQLWWQQVNVIFRQSPKYVNQGTPITIESDNCFCSRLILFFCSPAYRSG